MKRKLFVITAILVLSLVFSSVAFARDIDPFSFSLGNSNESDTTGKWMAESSIKATDNIEGAINCDTYTNSTYDYKTALFAAKSNSYRSSAYSWLNSDERVTPAWVSPYGDAGETHYCWARRDNRETVTTTTATGTWCPDEA